MSDFPPLQRTGVRIYKFGGASIKDVDGMRNVTQIIAEGVTAGPLIVVVSALGKTTNALEQVVRAYPDHANAQSLFTDIGKTHRTMASALGLAEVWIDDLLQNAQKQLATTFSNDGPTDQRYDAIVSTGECLSSQMLAELLRSANTRTLPWIDARTLLTTDNTYRAARVDADATNANINKAFADYPAGFITQGFVGRDSAGNTTTLGREGSDYTAALLGAALNAQSVTVWKDVPGVLNADPRSFSGTRLLPNLSYRTAAELTYFGAQIIHAKTLKPLAERGIPLQVASFITRQIGTVIGDTNDTDPSELLVSQPGIVLLSCQTRDFSFMTEWHFARIMQLSYEAGARVVLTQSSAMSASFCVPQDLDRADKLRAALAKEYDVHYNGGLTLLMCKNTTQAKQQELTADKQILIQQRTRTFDLYVLRDNTA